jgi:hypothetical protein
LRELKAGTSLPPTEPAANVEPELLPVEANFDPD